MKKLPLIFTAGCLLTNLAQAALLTDIDADAAVADYSSQIFTGPQPFSTTLNNWGRADNFIGADFSGLTLTIGDSSVNGGNNSNQPFLFSTIVNADFSGVTFNWAPSLTVDGHRINMFRQVAAGGNTANTGATFANSVWNIELAGTTLNPNNPTVNQGFFNDGAGVTVAANVADAVDFSGADFNFSGAGAATLNDDIAALLIGNLGGFDGFTAVGAFYDATFVANNSAAFGYASDAALESALDAAGWQAVPEPSSFALLVGFLGLGSVMVRRRSSSTCP